MAEVFGSQPRALQEYTRLVVAGGIEVLPCVGEFVFVTGADIEFRLVIGGKSFRLIKGDQIRVERFRDLEIHNLRDDVSITVRLVVGFGEFDRRIITGNLTAVPGILGADGTYRADTRYDLPLYLVKTPGTGYTVNAGTLVKTAYQFAAESNHNIGGDQSIFFDPSADSRALVFRSGSGGAKDQFFALDVQGGSVVKLMETDVPPSVRGVAWDSERYYVTGYDDVGFYNRKSIWSKPRFGTGSFTRLYQNSQNQSSSDGLAGMAIFGNHLYTLDTDDILWKFDKLSGNVLEQKSLSGILPSGVIADGLMFPRNGQMWIGDRQGGKDQYHIVNPDFSYVGISSGGQSYAPQWKAAASWYNWMIRVTDDDTIKIYDIEDHTYPIMGLAYDAKCGGQQLFSPPQYLDSNRSKAIVSVVNSGPVALVTGELIKMALEWYSGRELTTDYMDHVFGVELISAGPGSRGAPGRQVFKANGQTFAAAGIGDSFSMTLPGRVNLVLDRGLEYV